MELWKINPLILDTAVTMGGVGGMEQNWRVLTAECPQFLLYLRFLLTQYGK